MKIISHHVAIIISSLFFPFISVTTLYLFIPDVPVTSLIIVSVILTATVFLILHIYTLWQKKTIKHLTNNIGSLKKGEEVDLTIEVHESSERMTKDITENIDILTNHLNSVFIDISSSTRKFNLFASDIFFSARHLSDRSQEQSQTMDVILNQVSSFQKALSSLESDITEILEKLHVTTDVYRDLNERSIAASSRLKPLGDETEKASREALSGQRSVEQSAEVIQDLVETMNNMQAGMERMNEKTTRVSKVIVTLEDISESIHILGTNASIEAARAGQQGAGFAVIAAEVRKLASSSRDAIKDVGDFLKETSKDINENNLSWQTGLNNVNAVKNFGDNAREVLGSISSRMSEINKGMDDFKIQFRDQENIIGNTLNVSETINQRIIGFSETLNEQSRGYDEIQNLVKEASEGSEAASMSAKVLSQLATYLKVGGKELKYAVQHFKISESRKLASVTRQEKRRVLLYNLEMFQNGVFIGHLGDLSSSGLMIYSEIKFAIGQEFTSEIRLPIAFSHIEEISLLFTPRRIEPDEDLYRIGCTMRLKNQNQLGEFSEILEKLTLHEIDQTRAIQQPLDIQDEIAVDIDDDEEIEELCEI